MSLDWKPRSYSEDNLVAFIDGQAFYSSTYFDFDNLQSNKGLIPHIALKAGEAMQKKETEALDLRYNYHSIYLSVVRRIILCSSLKLPYLNINVIFLSEHTIQFLDARTHKFRFCQKSKKLSCVQKDMLEYALKIDLDLNENKTFNDMYNSATDCIQYCKANDEQVIRLYLQNHMFSHCVKYIP